MKPGKVSSKRVYNGRVINLDVDTVRFPNGSTGELEMIRHPGASAIVPFLTLEGHKNPVILLIKQYRYAADQYLYEVPAGRLEAGEPPERCARRELREETGYDAERFKLLFSMFTTPGFTDERIHVFQAFGLTAGKTAHEADEFMSSEEIPLHRAAEMVREGEIIDAKTALAVLLSVGQLSR